MADRRICSGLSGYPSIANLGPRCWESDVSPLGAPTLQPKAGRHLFFLLHASEFPFLQPALDPIVTGSGNPGNAGSPDLGALTGSLPTRGPSNHSIRSENGRSAAPAKGSWVVGIKSQQMDTSLGPETPVLGIHLTTAAARGQNQEADGTLTP